MSIMTTTVTTLVMATPCELWPRADRANGRATATSAYAVRKPNTDSEPYRSYMSEPVTLHMAIAVVPANINPAETITAAVGVPWRGLVRSNAGGRSLPWDMRMSTRAAAVVHASTHASMLMNAPISIATPSGEIPALPASFPDAL